MKRLIRKTSEFFRLVKKVKKIRIGFGSSHVKEESCNIR